jgi:hypothetical protein
MWNIKWRIGGGLGSYIFLDGFFIFGVYDEDG